MIEIKDIHKSFGVLQVLRGIDVTIKAGEIVSIVGPSGAGKTTLLQIAGTLDKPDSGKVLYDGVDVLSLSEKKLSAFRNRNIGFVFQFHQLLPEFTALENVAIPALIKGESRQAAYRRAAELLDYLGLSDRAGHKPSELSGGEKQRVVMARQLAKEPLFFLADEPTGALDSASGAAVMELFQQLHESGSTIIMITHDRSIANHAAKVMTIRDGVLSGGDNNG